MSKGPYKTKQPAKPLFQGTQYPTGKTMDKAWELKRETNHPIPALLHRAADIGLDILKAHPEYLFREFPVEKISAAKPT